MTEFNTFIFNNVQRCVSSLGRHGKVVVSLLIVLLTITGCANQGSGIVESGVADSVYVESENQDTRVRIVVIHHTTGDFQDSFHVLTKETSRPVSSHYLIPEPGDPSYANEDLKLYTLVKEEGRAWHAGVSYWAGKTALNDMSIGIELVNQTYCLNSKEVIPPEQTDKKPARLCFYPDFADTQLEILVDLLKGILERHS